MYSCQKECISKDISGKTLEKEFLQERNLPFDIFKIKQRIPDEQISYLISSL